MREPVAAGPARVVSHDCVPHGTVGRQTWLDLARGVAVVSMIVAHTSPWGGLWNLSEYLTAPLFAFLVGVSLHLAWLRAAREYGRYVLANVLRGLLLVVAGELLQAVYYPIIVVLQTLGILTILLAPLVPALVARPWAAYAVSVTAAGLSPWLMQAGRLWRSSARHPALVDWLVEVLVAGDAYRVSSFLALGAAGVAAAGLLLRTPREGVRGALPAVVLLIGSALLYVLGKATPIGADPYSGTTPEIAGSILLSASAAAACWWLVAELGERRARHYLGAVTATGRMALSAYALQILALAFIVGVWELRGDDHWAMSTGVTALCLTFCWAWLKVAPIGPLELVLRLPGTVLSPGRAEGGEEGGAEGRAEGRAGGRPDGRAR